MVLLQVGYLTSWSAYNTYVSEHPERPDPLVDFKHEFMSAARLASDQQLFPVSFPIFLMLCQRTA